MQEVNRELKKQISRAKKKKEFDLLTNEQKMFYSACKHGKLDLVKMLIDRDVDHGKGLYYACKHGDYPEIAKLLAEKVEDFNTAFKYCCLKNHIKTFTLLGKLQPELATAWAHKHDHYNLAFYLMELPGFDFTFCGYMTELLQVPVLAEYLIEYKKVEYYLCPSSDKNVLRTKYGYIKIKIVF